MDFSMRRARRGSSSVWLMWEYELARANKAGGDGGNVPANFELRRGHRTKFGGDCEEAIEGAIGERLNDGGGDSGDYSKGWELLWSVWSLRIKGVELAHRVLPSLTSARPYSSPNSSSRERKASSSRPSRRCPETRESIMN